jgi:hypothetical protein
MSTKKSKSGHIDLLRWLNQERLLNDFGSGIYGRNTAASRNRVVRLLRALQNASVELTENVAEGTTRDYWGDPPKALTKRLRVIDEMLYQYPTRPTVEIMNKDGFGGLWIDFGSTHGRPLGEQSAVFTIQRLLNNRELERVQQCKCGRWYYSRRTDQKACSPKCRHKIYEQTPDAKARRKQYMRDYYQLKQSGKVK